MLWLVAGRLFLPVGSIVYTSTKRFCFCGCCGCCFCCCFVVVVVVAYLGFVVLVVVGFVDGFCCGCCLVL